MGTNRQPLPDVGMQMMQANSTCIPQAAQKRSRYQTDVSDGLATHNHGLDEVSSLQVCAREVAVPTVGGREVCSLQLLVGEVPAFDVCLAILLRCAKPKLATRSILVLVQLCTTPARGTRVLYIT